MASSPTVLLPWPSIITAGPDEIVGTVFTVLKKSCRVSEEPAILQDVQSTSQNVLAFASDTQAPMLVETILLKPQRNRKATELLFADVLVRQPAAFFLLGDVVSLMLGPMIAATAAGSGGPSTATCRPCGQAMCRCMPSLAIMK